LAHIATQALYDRRNTRTLRDQATTDSVTGLLNIRGFFEAFQSLTEPSQHAILFMDLDDFKLVNDKHGHSVGNTVLDIVGRRIRKSVRADDIVARIGGDEFAVLLDADTASAVALRIGRAVEKPLQIEALTIDVRISIGTPAPVDQLTFDEVMKAADDRMYEQKRERKDATGLLAVSAGLVAEVIGAIRGGVVEVAFQPVVDVAGGHIVGFEALARYTRPDNTPLSPPTLIDIARDQEVLDDLTLQITDRALHHMTAFQAITPEVSLLSINIEADQLLRNDFVNAMRARRVQHPAIQMCLELTENSLGRVDHTIIDRVRELAAEGFIIALDDYGQEHAAAGALLTTPLSLVKIDRVFLADESNPKHETILRSILGLLADLNLETIVEGVETLSAHQLLTQLKAGHAQGYFYGRPLAPDQIESRLRDTGTAAILNDAH
jgi:diguanylate cyclase (GGDEF)-like protein